MRSLVFAFEEAVVSLRRGGRAATLSIATIVVAFLTLGGFLLIAANLQSIVARWAEAAELSIFLHDDVAADAQQALAAEIARHEAVDAVDVVDSEQARERFARDFPELADVALSSGTTFPPSIEVRLKPDAEAAAADDVARIASARGEVVDVRYDRAWLSRLLTLIDTVRAAGLLVAGVLVLGAAVTVMAVVRLSMQARREEIEIMQLVGAPLAFIRGPSIAEGALLGGLGALAALVVLWVGFMATREAWQPVLAAWRSDGAVRFLGVVDIALLVCGGIVVGAIAGSVASRLARE